MKTFVTRHTPRTIGMRRLVISTIFSLVSGACVPQTKTSVASTSPETPAPRPIPKPTPKPKPRVAAPKLLVNWARGKVVRQVKTAKNTRAIALTFDDGPWPHSTLQILKTLREEKVPATFYMLGSCVQNYPQLARAVKADGHEIGNHSWSHPIRTRNAKAEIDRTDAIIQRTVGVRPLTFRPPYGILHNGLADVAKSQGKAIVLWSADSMDWRHATSSSILSHLKRQSGPGGIALMHDGGGNRSATVAALPTLISSLRARGFRFVTVSQLLAMRLAPKPARDPKTARFHLGPPPQKPRKTVKHARPASH